MHFIGWIVFGLIVGAIARLLMPGRQPMGLIVTCLLGIAGSFIGGYIASAIHGGPMDASQPAGWIGAVLGALLLLFLYGMFARSTAPPQA
jgi:uncharacterized membrane protein YeaQ/YmgE (transglycosylase-associated protein family)